MIFDWKRIEKIANSARWSETMANFIVEFRKAKTVGYIAHGGNLGIADHAAIDATRHTEKMCYAPGSGVVATSLFNDCGDDWQKSWIEHTKLDAYIIITTTGKAESITRAVTYLEDNNIPHLVITGRPHFAHEVVLDLEYYHEMEVAALATTYNILDLAGYTCPKIP